MSILKMVAPYAVAYVFLSLCVALVVGRLLRTMNPIEEIPETDALIEMPGRTPTAQTSRRLVTAR